MIPLRLDEVAAGVGGRLVGGADPAAVVTGPVVVDSRQVGAGGLFVAVAGARVDGHDYAAAAVAAGAVAVLAQREVTAPAVVVPDTVDALGRLARLSLDRLPGTTVVGITGSSGKTSTKDLLAQVLAPLGPVVAPRGSYNNEIGLPLTVLAADASTRTLVLEMGARGIGHIAALCRIAPPSVGVVLNVGAAHIGEFGSREVTAKAKGELVEVLPPDGVAILNADDGLVRAMAGRTRAAVVLVGESRDADVRADDVTLDEQGRAGFSLRTPSGTAPVRLLVVGAHHVGNAVAVAAVAHVLGMGTADIAKELSAATARSRWRMEVVQRGDGVTVVNDAYNANPDSMRAALKALVAMAHGRRTWAVLGEMGELGVTAAEEHDALGRLAVRLDVSRLVAVGAAARPVHLGAAHEGSWGDESTWVPDQAAALRLLRSELTAGDVVLVKASRAVGLEALAEALVQDSPPAGWPGGGDSPPDSPPAGPP